MDLKNSKLNFKKTSVISSALFTLLLVPTISFSANLDLGTFFNPKSWSQNTKPGDVHYYINPNNNEYVYFKARFTGSAASPERDFPTDFTSNSDWEYAGRARRVSLYNIRYGTLLYAQGSTKYVSSNYANSLTSSPWNIKANWYIHYMPNGEMMFRNNHFNGKNNNDDLCLSTYSGNDYQVATYKCNIADRKQRFKLLPTESGATLIKNSEFNGVCLYTHSGDSYYYVYAKTCPQTQSTEVASQWLWSLIPTLEASKPMSCAKGQLGCKR